MEAKPGGGAQTRFTTDDVPIGLVIDGKYRIEHALGAGAMGVVMAAEHTQLGERVALKFLSLHAPGAEAVFRTRFRREAQICAKVKNAHITRVLDLGAYRDVDYMVMELLEGVDLRTFARTHELSAEAAVALALQICDGLAPVHALGIVHRDLKPSNLFVVSGADGGPLLKILDFGVSKWGVDLDGIDDELTKSGMVLGSPRYMAPEQLFGANTVDARADVWSIGAILFELLTGKTPLRESSLPRLAARLASGAPLPRPRQLRPEIPEELDEAVMACLERNPALRTPSVEDLALDLLTAIGAPDAASVRQRLSSALAVSGERLRPTRAGQLARASTSSAHWVAAGPSIDIELTPPSRARGWLLTALVAVTACLVIALMRFG